MLFMIVFLLASPLSVPLFCFGVFFSHPLVRFSPVLPHLDQDVFISSRNISVRGCSTDLHAFTVQRHEEGKRGKDEWDSSSFHVCLAAALIKFCRGAPRAQSDYAGDTRVCACHQAAAIRLNTIE